MKKTDIKKLITYYALFILSFFCSAQEIQNLLIDPNFEQLEYIRSFNQEGKMYCAIKGERPGYIKSQGKGFLQNANMTKVTVDSYIFFEMGENFTVGEANVLNVKQGTGAYTVHTKASPPFKKFFASHEIDLELDDIKAMYPNAFKSSAEESFPILTKPSFTGYVQGSGFTAKAPFKLTSIMTKPDQAGLLKPTSEEKYELDFDFEIKDNEFWQMGIANIDNYTGNVWVIYQNYVKKDKLRKSNHHLEKRWVVYNHQGQVLQEEAKNFNLPFTYEFIQTIRNDKTNESEGQLLILKHPEGIGAGVKKEFPDLDYSSRKIIVLDNKGKIKHEFDTQYKGKAFDAYSSAEGISFLVNMVEKGKDIGYQKFDITAGGISKSNFLDAKQLKTITDRVSNASGTIEARSQSVFHLSNADKLSAFQANEYDMVNNADRYQNVSISIRDNTGDFKKIANFPSYKEADRSQLTTVQVDEFGPHNFRLRLTDRSPAGALLKQQFIISGEDYTIASLEPSRGNLIAAFPEPGNSGNWILISKITETSIVKTTEVLVERLSF